MVKEKVFFLISGATADRSDQLNNMYVGFSICGLIFLMKIFSLEVRDPYPEGKKQIGASMFFLTNCILLLSCEVMS